MDIIDWEFWLLPATVAVVVVAWDLIQRRNVKAHHLEEEAELKYSRPGYREDRFPTSENVGEIAFNTPSEMVLGQQTVIELFVSKTESTLLLMSLIKAEGDREGARVQVSDRMKANLRGGGFEITSLAEETQALEGADRVRWAWSIQAKTKGVQPLFLTLAIIVKVEGESTPRTVKTFEKEIRVRVTPAQHVSGFVAKHWQWLWAAVLLPLAGLIAAVFFPEK